ncbi:putative mitochondrial protein [Abeliophyllum distichum]|uniref:Mitochondrial protein n=1 Tax=Abeliophyllum distichum TaxID=126358 RepID=A0ABD1NWA1_9LAMI
MGVLHQMKPRRVHLPLQSLSSGEGVFINNPVSTIIIPLFLKQSPTLSLTAFTDVDWAGNVDDRTSTSAYVIYLGGNAVSWYSKKQKSVAQSSTEAEYRALASCAYEVLWLRNFLH